MRPARPPAPDGAAAPWSLVAALAATETVSWGILYYAFAVLLVPMQRELELSAAQLSGAFSLGLLVSALTGVGIGRYLDSHGPRALMASGSAAAAALVAAWSQVDSLAVFYLIWVGIGLAMATVLYEPAFTVLAKSFRDPASRRRALTTLTLVAALASFIFMPLTQTLVDAHGWRSALLVLAALLALTAPIHALALPGEVPQAGMVRARRSGAGDASEALRSAQFWLLSAALFLASLAAIGTMIHAIPFLLERGHGAGFAAFAVGLVGVSQIPGRLLFAPLERRVSPEASIATVFALVAGGIALTVAAPATPLVMAGLALLGIGNGMTTLARATVVADDYGTTEYGTIAGRLAATTTTARAAGPFASALLASALGYSTLLWTLSLLATTSAGLGWLSRREPSTNPITERLQTATTQSTRSRAPSGASRAVSARQ